ncbi:MAG: S41 family peptidase [bacterium]|nr:S41 family peptidase [bacterium]
MGSKKTGLFVMAAFFFLSLPSVSFGKSDKKDSEDLYKNLDLFSTVLHNVENDYVEPVNDKELIYGAIRGMLDTLDPHSQFMSPDVYKELQIDTEGRFGGVGVEITIRDKALIVVSPLEGTPADLAGLKAGDQILQIDGVPTEGLSLNDTVKKMRGKKGTSVKLKILRKGKEPFEVALVRDRIQVKSVSGDLTEGRYGSVRIVSFQERTTKELEQVLNRLTKEAQGKLAGLVLDLRNNPGGLLEEAVGVSDTFLDKGVIVTTSNRTEEIDKREAVAEGTFPNVPLVVLVNGGSASASEIVAGALQDNGRALIMGTKTFGKGSVQTVYDLGDGSALKLTVAKYFTPSGRSIQADGISPDILVTSEEEGKKVVVEKKFLREEDLKGHLEATKVEPKNASDTTQDFQKEVALAYLKGLDLFQSLKKN